MEGMDFTQGDSFDLGKLDELPYGAIVLDESGKIVAYNQAEGQHADLEPESVVGKNFFTEVAPCTQVGLFYEQFQRVMHSGKAGTIATFHFDYDLPGRPRDVDITLVCFDYKGEKLCLVLAVDRPK